MNTATHQPRRKSEGAESVQRLLADTRRGQMPQPYLLTPVAGSTPVQANADRRPRAPLRLIKTRERASVCGFGVCALSPECTSNCKYREADEALSGHYSSRHTQRQAMPPLPVQSHQRPARNMERWVVIGVMLVAFLSVALPFGAALVAHLSR